MFGICWGSFCKEKGLFCLDQCIIMVAGFHTGFLAEGGGGIIWGPPEKIW